MDPNVRRDLLVGASLVIVGVALLGFAFFAGDEGFRAPRWVVGAVAIGCTVGGAIPLRSAIDTGNLIAANAFASVGAGTLLLILALVSVWVMIAVGPEGTAVTLDVPLPISERVEHSVKSFLFHALMGLVVALCLAGAFATMKSVRHLLGRTAIVAVVAPMVGLAVWIAIEVNRQASSPLAPVVFLSFDRRFPSDEYFARPHGDEVVARPGRRGTGLFVGGNEDWLDVQAPTGFDTKHGLTLEFWMKRENWINPYAKGSRSQVVATVDIERDWKGRPELLQMAFSLALSAPRGETLEKEERKARPDPFARRPDNFIFRPNARVGEVRLVPARALTVPADRWIHVAVVYDRFLFDRMRLYVDGRQVARAVPWGSAPGFADIRSIRIGTAAERSGAYRGMVDEVKVYARALSDDEIANDAGRGS